MSSIRSIEDQYDSQEEEGTEGGVLSTVPISMKYDNTGDKHKFYFFVPLSWLMFNINKTLSIPV